MHPAIRTLVIAVAAGVAVGAASDVARAQSQPSVQVDMTVLDELGPAPRGPAAAPVVLTPPRAGDHPGPVAAPARAAPRNTETARAPAAPPQEQPVAPPAETVREAPPPAPPSAPEPPAVAQSPATPAGPPKTGTEPAQTAARTPAGAVRIDFEKGSAELPGTAAASLTPLTRTLSAEPGAFLAIHAYAQGTAATEQAARRLALSRALAVRRQLEASGINGSRARIEAHGIDPAGGPPDRVDLVIEKR